MKKNPFNAHVYATVSDLTLLQKSAKRTHLPHTKKQTLSSATGTTKSPFKTKGLDFVEVRAYQAGDDIRQIDWRVTAKYGKPFTKLYMDEKERQVVLICDLRTHMKFASTGDFKSVIVAKITALLGWIGAAKGDLTRLILIHPQILKITKPAKGEEALLPYLKELSDATDPTQFIPDTLSLNATCNQIIASIPKGALVFFCSDFHDFSEETLKECAKLSEKATLSFVHIFDEFEEKLPSEILPLTDGTDVVLADMKSLSHQHLFMQAYEKTVALLEKAVKTHGLGYLPIRTNDPYINKVITYCEGGRN